jgi:hypothetical protein
VTTPRTEAASQGTGNRFGNRDHKGSASRVSAAPPVPITTATVAPTASARRYSTELTGPPPKPTTMTCSGRIPNSNKSVQFRRSCSGENLSWPQITSWS